MIENNVIHVDHPTFYCMRQCKESIKWCEKQNNPIYQTEIAGEKALLETFMKNVLERAA